MGLFGAYEALATYMYLDENFTLGSEVGRAYTPMKNSPILNRSHVEEVKAYYIDQAKVHYNKGREFDAKKDWEGMLREMHQARRSDPNNQPAWFDEGYALIQLERYEEALTICNMAIKLSPNDYIAWNNKGVALGRLNNQEGAFACYNTAAAINPKYEIAQNNWEQTLKALGRIKVELPMGTIYYPDSSGTPSSKDRCASRSYMAEATNRSAYINGARHLFCQVSYEGKVYEIWVKPKDFQFPQFQQGGKD